MNKKKLIIALAIGILIGLHIENNFIPGKVVSEKVIACGDSAIEILSVKPECKKVMYVEDYLRGNSMSVGEILE